jgi:hypothetical protein
MTSVSWYFRHGSSYDGRPDKLIIATLVRGRLECLEVRFKDTTVTSLKIDLDGRKLTQKEDRNIRYGCHPFKAR